MTDYEIYLLKQTIKRCNNVLQRLCEKCKNHTTCKEYNQLLNIEKEKDKNEE